MEHCFEGTEAYNPKELLVSLNGTDLIKGCSEEAWKT